MLDLRGVATTTEDSALGRWMHAEWKPAADDTLARLVARIWYFDGATSQPVERVLPDGTHEIIVQLDERYRPERGDEPFPALNFEGLRERAIAIRAPGTRCRVLGIRLHAAGAIAVLSHPLDAIGGLSLDLHDLIGRAAAELGERCHATSDGVAAIGQCVRWLRARIAGGRAPDPCVRWLAERILQAGGAISVAALCAETARDPSRLARAFRVHAGVTPKRYARIVRFHHAARLLAAGATLADTAVRAGFYDQPHFTAEFRAHAGMTPLAFVTAQRFPATTSLAGGA